MIIKIWSSILLAVSLALTYFFNKTKRQKKKLDNLKRAIKTQAVVNKANIERVKFGVAQEQKASSLNNNIKQVNKQLKQEVKNEKDTDNSNFSSVKL